MDRASSSVTLTAEAMGDQIRTDIEIIEKANVSVAGYPRCNIWIKNIGSLTIDKISTTTDVFFGKTGDFTRMTYKDSLVDNSWTYVPPSNGRWKPKETLEITIEYDEEFSTDDYYVKIILYNGESAEDVFSFSST
jgi:archaellum component FlaG (FlaF/FlaG flagellin family)